MPRPKPLPSDTLTSVTPPSFVDDGISFTRRMPRSGDPTTIDKWIEDTVAPPVLPPTSAASNSEAYTGSFFDDGADMLYPSHTQIIPGFGVMERKFYSKGKPKKGVYEEEWTVEKEKALAGDMFRSLARLKSVARVKVRDGEEVERRRARREKKEGKVGAIEDDGRVRIMKPLKWGTFVIEGKDGRVVIVDGQGEYDSGKVDEREELERRENEYEERVARKKERERKRAEREAKAEAEEEARRLKKQEEENEKERRRAEFRDQQRRDKHHRYRRHTSPLKSLTPISESDTSEEAASSVVSSTKFFMTGAPSGWSSTVPLPTKASAQPPSPAKPPSGAWPASQPSPTKSAPSMRSLRAATVHSTITSVTKSEDSWTARKSRSKEASAAVLPSSVSSAKYSDATSSAISAAASQNSQAKVNTRLPDVDKKSARGSTKDEVSLDQSRAGSIYSRREDVDKQASRGSSRRATPVSRSKASSITTRKEDADKHSARSSSRRGRSRGPSRASFVDVWNLEPGSTSARNSSKGGTSFTSLKAGSNGSWRREVDVFETRVLRKTLRSPTQSPIVSGSAWIQDSAHDAAPSARSPAKSAASRVSATTSNQNADFPPAPSLRSHKSAASQTSAITPYSWRRQVEELSDHSTVGSNGSPSRISSPVPSDDRRSDGEDIQERQDDTHSIKSHSTYRAPTVEDAQSEEEGAQEWDSAWSARDSQRDGQKGDRMGSEAGTAKWSGKTGWSGDVAPSASVAGSAQWNGSAAGSGARAGGGDWKDNSGYEEDNDTWLNAEVGGVKYREAAWRTDPPAGSWRDV